MLCWTAWSYGPEPSACWVLTRVCLFYASSTSCATTVICGGQIYGSHESVGMPQRRAERAGDPRRYAEGLLSVCRVLGKGASRLIQLSVLMLVLVVVMLLLLLIVAAVSGEQLHG